MGERRTWTEAIELSWKPALRFYEQWAAFLRQLEDTDRLLAFNAADRSWISALVGRAEMVEFGPSGMSLMLVGPKANRELIVESAETLLELLAPKDPVVTHIRFQHACPVDDLDYLGARQRMVEALIGTQFSSSLATDSAVLLDGEMTIDGDSPSTFQVEFGVIDKTEAPDRIRRNAGRMSGYSIGPLSSAATKLDIPDVAFFADWLVTPKKNVLEVRSLARIWESASETTASATEQLGRTLKLHEEPADGAE